MKNNIFNQATEVNEEEIIKKELVDLITECPVCNRVLDPRLISFDYIELENVYENVIGAFYCKKCCSVFFAKFHHSYSGVYLLGIYPKYHQKISFPQNITNLSPVFAECFNQSSQAENDNLNLIAGVGYRKALEFLIKDYAIYTHPDDENSIKIMPLAQVIKKYIDNNKIQQLATAATWLGNDETHYERKITDYNLTDMKRFIKAMVNYIENEFIFCESVALISKREDSKK